MMKKLHTPAGLKYGSYGMMLEIVVSILALITLVPLATLLYTTDLSPATAGFILGMACLISIIGVVAFIFWLLLLYEMYVGKREFGPKHASRVSAGIILIILGIVLMIIGIIVAVAAMFSAGTFVPDGNGGTFDIDAAHYRTSAIIGMVFTIASAVAVNLALVYFALEIIEGEKRNILWVAFALAIVAPVVSSLITIASLPTSGTLDSSEINTIAPFANVAEIFGLIGTALFFIAYRAARQRILDGKIQPVLAQPVQPPPPMAPPPTWGQEPPPATVEEPPKWEELEPVDEPKE